MVKPQGIVCLWSSTTKIQWFPVAIRRVETQSVSVGVTPRPVTVRSIPTIKVLIQGTGLSMQEIARRSGINVGSLSHILRGARGATMASVLKIVDGSGIPADTLLRALVVARREWLQRRNVARLCGQPKRPFSF